MASKRSNEGITKPPAHLREPTRRWFAGVIAEYELQPHHVRLLTLAGEAWDRATEAREGIEKHGLTFSDHRGIPKARPEIAIERDSRIAFARMIRELRLDVADPDDQRIPRAASHGLRLKGAM